MASVIKSEKTEIIINDSGEVIDSKRKVTTCQRSIVGGDRYFIVTISDVGTLLNLAPTPLKVFLFLSSLLDYQNENNHVDISPSVRKRICDTVGIHKKTLRNALCDLRKKGFLLMLSESTECLSPFHVYSGSLKMLPNLKEEFTELVKHKKLESVQN